MILKFFRTVLHFLKFIRLFYRKHQVFYAKANFYYDRYFMVLVSLYFRLNQLSIRLSLSPPPAIQTMFLIQFPHRKFQYFPVSKCIPSGLFYVFQIDLDHNRDQ